MCKIVDSDLCSFCSQEEETLYHLFWHCELTQIFWTNLKLALNESCVHCFGTIFTETLILFGHKDNVVTDKVLDLLIMLAKFYYIYNMYIFNFQV